MKLPKSAGGFPSILYTLKKGLESGSFIKMWNRLRSSNACKTCALGMGGQRGGMVNEEGSFPEVCKKVFKQLFLIWEKQFQMNSGSQTQIYKLDQWIHAL